MIRYLLLLIGLGAGLLLALTAPRYDGQWLLGVILAGPWLVHTFITAHQLITKETP